MAKTKLYRTCENSNGPVFFVSILTATIGLSSCSTVGMLPVAKNETGPWLKVGSFAFVDDSYKSLGGDCESARLALFLLCVWQIIRAPVLTSPR